MDRAPHPCPWPGCSALTTHLRGCPIHRPPSSGYARGYDREWIKVSRPWLRRHPVCARCGGRATVVDHKIPLRGGGARLDPRNWQALCHRCHVWKTHHDHPERYELARLWR